MSSRSKRIPRRLGSYFPVRMTTGSTGGGATPWTLELDVEDVRVLLAAVEILLAALAPSPQPCSDSRATRSAQRASIAANSRALATGIAYE